MAMYRVYFLSFDQIIGREDFAAETDAAAVSIAAILCEACSDLCQSFELWDRVRCVWERLPRTLPTGMDDLNAASQRVAVETEEAISRSKWQIAQSQRLLKRLAQARSRY